MLKITSLVHSYSDSSSIQYPDWEVPQGEHSMILGKSGSGKTTLLHLIGGLLKTKSGEITIDNNTISSMSQGELDRFRGMNIGIVFQKAHLIRSLTVADNLVVSQYFGQKKVDKKAVNEILKQLDIEDLKDRKVHQISQGQAQRVSIGRALLNKPKLLLADEPTASLDDDNCEKVINLLREQAELSNSTLIVATHDLRVQRNIKNALEL